MAKNNKTCFFYVLYSDKTWVFDQSVKLSRESQTICALLVKVCTVFTLCDVGLSDIWSSSLSVCVGFL